MVIGALLVLAGLGCVVASALAWTGRWRSWSRRVLTGPLPYPLTALPAIGVALLGAGLYELDVLASGSALGALVLLCLVAGMALYLWSPSWIGPAWYKAERAHGFQPDLSEPITALAYAATGPAAGRPTAAAEARRHTGTADALERWTATWVMHEDGGDKPHAGARAGAVGGKLELYPSSVVFRAGEIEDRLRDEPVVAVIDRAALRGARVVPRGAGPDGVKRRGSGPRSAFARLVVDADDGPYLFEVNGAKAKARRIEEVLGR